MSDALLKRFGYVSEEDVARLLGVTVKTLKNRRHSDLPEFVKSGRRRLFKEASVQTYLEQHVVNPAE
jgi:excisionase family DNA binding protein